MAEPHISCALSWQLSRAGECNTPEHRYFGMRLCRGLVVSVGGAQELSCCIGRSHSHQLVPRKFAMRQLA